jgi:hypothetical protein
MMKLAVALVLFAAPAFACPNMDHDQAAPPKTADKAKEQPKKEEAPAKKDDAKPADTAKKKDDAKPAEKKPGDKVSLK